MLHDLDDRPVRDALPVGKTAAPHDRCVDTVQELGGEARFPDACRAEQREQSARAVAKGIGERVLEQLALVFAADQRRFQMSHRWDCVVPHLEKPVRLQRNGLALQFEWL